MKLKCLLFTVCGILAANVFAQQKITLDRIRVSKPVDVAMPVMMDSTNLKGEKFETKNLLETFVSLPASEEFTEEVRADLVRQFFYFQKPQKNARFQFLSFQLTADRYSKATLKIASPSMFELFVNGKKELSKTSIQDSIQQAKVADKEITALQGATNTIVIKYLTLTNNKSPEGVKVTIESQTNDSLTHFSIGYGGEKQLSLEDVLTGTRVTTIAPSPNGRFALIDYRTVNDDGANTTHHELLNLQTNRRTNIAKWGRWMPKSNRFYYTNRLGDKLQLMSFDPETHSEEVMAENIPSGDFVMLYNEQALIYTEKESNNERKGDLRLLASPEDRQGGYYDRYFISSYNLATGVKQRITFGRKSTFVNDGSNDSRYILFSQADETITESPFRKVSMYLLDMQSMTVDTLFTDEPFVNSASFSPDASKIIVLGSPEAFNGIGKNVGEGVIPNSYDMQAYIMDISTKKIEAITKDFTPSIEDATWNFVDNKIYLKVIEGDREPIYRYDPVRKSFSKLNLPEDVIRSFNLSRGSLAASYIGTSASNPAKAYFVDLRNDNSTLVSDPMSKLGESLTLGEVKDWNFTSADGTTIEGRYYLPPNFDPAKKYPMIVYYYGGTTPTNRAFDHPYPMHVYAAQGYVVYVLQPSGTIGYGQEFSARHVNAWGKRTAEEIIEGTKSFVSAHPFVDGRKIGCIGASYGGFMTMYLQTQTDIFAAAVSHAGISSLSSYWGEGYWGYTYSSGASRDSYPWNNRELYVEQSPLFNADKIHTPLLLLHGMDDTNVPVGESIQMYTALKILGRPVEFIQIKGENHHINNLKRRIEWKNSIFAWFAKWLKDDPAWWNDLYPPAK